MIHKFLSVTVILLSTFVCSADASAQVAKESLAVIGLVLAGAVLAMLATFLAPELFARASGPAVCVSLDPWSLLSPWCSAAI